MGEESIGKVLVQQFADNFANIRESFHDVENDISYLSKSIKKNKRKIRGLTCTAFFFGIGLLVAASELAERKRSENYLKAEIDELKERVDKLERPDDAEAQEKENDGGAADA